MREVALVESKFLCRLNDALQLLTSLDSLATMEMKILLREIYSRFRTTIAPDMTADMTLDDQIISARPKGQQCLLIFESV